MDKKINNLEELSRKKRLLKEELKDLENLLTFKNTKESLSAFTNGFTDPYLKEELDENGEEKTVIRKDIIAQQLTSEVKDLLISRSPALNFANYALSGNNVVNGALKLAVTAYVAKYAKKNMKSTNWKKKAVGVALIYVAPIALKFLRKKLESYQKKKKCF